MPRVRSQIYVRNRFVSSSFYFADFARQKRVCRCENRPTEGRQVPSENAVTAPVCSSPNPPVADGHITSDVRVQTDCALGDPIELRGKNSVIATIRVSFPLRVALAVSASVRSGPDQAPAGWKSGAERGAEIHVVVEVPDPRPASDRIVK